MIPACQILPLPDHQVAFVLNGRERLRWHFGTQYPRPFLYPLIGPSGQSLTRMGHPGAPDHDHHRSIWFAHEKVQGVNFWSDRTTARIRQKQWLAYQDGRDDALMAVLLGWNDGHDAKDLLEQKLIVAVRPGEKDELLVEFQSTFRPTADSLEFGRTNFGFLAVRVAKSISEHFGGGKLTDAVGRIGEPAIFEKTAAWMDYSGEVAEGVTEGITYFDHPANPGHPTGWHVRSDGWMGASPCMAGPIAITKAKPLILRYLLHAHRGACEPKRAGEVQKAFGATPRFEVGRSMIKHTQWQVRRVESK